MLKTERIHSLDSLRAVMMLLGLILHSALTYNVTDHGDDWSLKDPLTTHVLTDFLILLIHSFRMPIFFFVGGFFGAMLFYERGSIAMIKNRISRIVYPFIVFIFLLWPFTAFAFSYTNAVFAYQPDPLSNTLAYFSNIEAYLPQTTLHLWFLYYLILITLAAFLLALLLSKAPALTSRMKQIFDWIIPKPLARFLVFSGSTFIILTICGTYMVQTPVSFIPNINTLAFFSFFYLIGWLLFKSKNHLNSFTRFDWLCTISAVILTIIKGSIIQNSSFTPTEASGLMILYSSLIVSLFLLGITGLFIRYTSRPSKIMRYISDSSYWIYLIHLPIAALLPSFIYSFPVSVLVKFLFVISITTLICVTSYHYLVRGTFIGKFLNGRKYKST